MNDDEIVKEIIVALVNHNFFMTVEDVCKAYKEISKVVANPFNE